MEEDPLLGKERCSAVVVTGEDTGMDTGTALPHGRCHHICKESPKKCYSADWFRARGCVAGTEPAVESFGSMVIHLS